MDICEQLEIERQQLLDIGTRNRLVSTPLQNSRAKQIEIIHERSKDVFDLLVTQRKAMNFLPLGEDEEAQEGAEGEEVQDSRKKILLDLMTEEATSPDPAHFRDKNLQTRLRPRTLVSRLRDLYLESRTFVEEQGANPLYLALGFLKWNDGTSERVDRYAPLILLPAEIARVGSQAQFRLTASDDDLSTNLSLQHKLKTDFDILFPDLPADDLDVEAYFDEVERAVSAKPDWEVLRNEILLGFFQFAKFLMYRDLDPGNWPARDALESHPLLTSLLQKGFEPVDPPVSEDERVENRIRPSQMVHVVDADSSQMVVIEEVRAGNSLVIQGPPGTGKSQTITNLIAAAVGDGKRVLFLAEKMAALEVVHQRLASVGLGDLCLELHSNKSRKKLVLAELAHTLSLRDEPVSVSSGVRNDIDNLTDRLNRVVDAIHSPVGRSGQTPYIIIGALIRLERKYHFPEQIRRQAAVENAEKLPVRQFAALRQELRELAEHVRAMGSPQRHLFRGAKCTVLLRTDIDTLRSQLNDLAALLKDLLSSVQQLSALLKVAGDADQLSIGRLRPLLSLARAVAAAPDPDPAIAGDVWETELDTLETLVRKGLEYQQACQRLEGRLNDDTDDLSISEARRHLNAYGRRFVLFRIFNGKYRAAMNTLRELLREPPPKDVDQQIAILDDVLAVRAFADVLSKTEKTAAEAFGQDWKGEASDWEKLKAVVDWVRHGREQKLARQFRLVCSRFQGDREVPRKLADDIEQKISRIEPALTPVLERLQMPLSVFGSEDLQAVSLVKLRMWAEAAAGSTEQLTDWIRYREKRDSLNHPTVAKFVAMVDREQISCDLAPRLFEWGWLEQLLRHAFETREELRQFSGQSYTAMREQFCRTDRQLLDVSRHEVAKVHREGIPQGSLGGMGVLQHEIQKKSRHKAIRRLLKEAGPAVQRIKPVFMMSPLSVAQYLEPGAVEFDLLLIDEASQIEPVDALGAAARCRQMVVVGDQKQLPPTRFFMKSAEADEDDPDAARDLESILGLCLARGLSQRMLRWHYRSRHQDLIAVSNEEYYDNRLFVVPSPIRSHPEFGVHFFHVKDGVYDRGGTAQNAVEAMRVAEYVLEHARRCPQLSLGVGTFSIRQRDAVLDEVELLERQHSELREFLARTGADSFFVKNLETIQGDERDVIVISVGYGRDAAGVMTQNFGPLNRDGGERRLNVLISRARQKCCVFSSITAEDINETPTTPAGVRGLKKFLRFAQYGPQQNGASIRRDAQSAFEKAVAQTLADAGYTVESQVGQAGFFIDLAVVDPQDPGHYLLGIESDGPTWASARSTRDRERLRDEVLQSRNWKIQRVWSVDWYHQPVQEAEKLLAVVRQAENEDREFTAEPADTTIRQPVVIKTEVADNPDESCGAESRAAREYGIAVQDYRETAAMPDVPTPLTEQSSDVVDRVVSEIIRTEGPVHFDQTARRAATVTGGRLTSRLSRTIQESVERLAEQGQVRREGDFLAPVDRPQLSTVRDRSQAQEAGLRKAEFIPPEEIRLAALQLLEANGNAARDELLRAIGAVLGLRQAYAQFKASADKILQELIDQGIINEHDGLLSLAERDNGTRASDALSVSRQNLP